MFKKIIGDAIARQKFITESVVIKLKFSDLREKIAEELDKKIAQEIMIDLDDVYAHKNMDSKLKLKYLWREFDNVFYIALVIGVIIIGFSAVSTTKLDISILFGIITFIIIFFISIISITRKGPSAEDIEKYKKIVEKM